MCIISAKYFPELESWSLIKNRDRTYRPIIRIRKSFRNNIERLFIYDEKTKYSEGLNEHGISILSATVLEDDSPNDTYSPDGFKIRTALLESNIQAAIGKLIELEMVGNILIADKEQCFILEATNKNEEGEDEYTHELKEVPQEHIVVRTNHGILLPWINKQVSEENSHEYVISSQIRYEKAVEGISKAENPMEMLDALSIQDDKNPQMNPMRIDETPKALRTTGQIICTPGNNVLHYRIVWCDVLSKLDSINNKEEKTSFEIISARKLLTFKESIGE